MIALAQRSGRALPRRLASAASLAEEAGIAAILVGVGADMRYLTGYPAMPPNA
jgi:hypothetical protein